jgi:hypothetical protein
MSNEILKEFAVLMTVCLLLFDVETGPYIEHRRE